MKKTPELDKAHIHTILFVKKFLPSIIIRLTRLTWYLVTFFFSLKVYFETVETVKKEAARVMNKLKDDD